MLGYTYPDLGTRFNVDPERFSRLRQLNDDHNANVDGLNVLPVYEEMDIVENDDDIDDDLDDYFGFQIGTEFRCGNDYTCSYFIVDISSKYVTIRKDRKGKDNGQRSTIFLSMFEENWRHGCFSKIRED